MHKTLQAATCRVGRCPGRLSAPTTSCWIRAADGVLATAGLAPLLDDVLSVERVGAFKPDPRVYHFAVDRLGVEPAELAFLTANAWDAAGAAAAGLSVHWINRTAAPDEYGLRGSATELASLSAFAPLVRSQRR